MSAIMEQRSRRSSGLVTIVAAATTTALLVMQAVKLYRVKKIMAWNGQGANVDLVIGYDDVGGVWVPCSPPFVCIPALDNEWAEADIPIFGNTTEGFLIDTTLVTGFAGVIAARASAAGAAPANVLVVVEFEELG